MKNKEKENKNNQQQIIRKKKDTKIIKALPSNFPVSQGQGWVSLLHIKLLDPHR